MSESNGGCFMHAKHFSSSWCDVKVKDAIWTTWTDGYEVDKLHLSLSPMRVA